MVEPTNPNLKGAGYKDESEVLETVLDKNNRIEFLRVVFPDILGRMMSFTIPSYELEDAFRNGKGFDGSSVEGFVRIEESDLVIKPDPRTLRLLPWEYKGFHEGVRWREGILFGDILKPDGSPYEGDSRFILKKVLERGRKEFDVDDIKVGPELEFFIFPGADDARPLDDGGYFFGGLHGGIRKEIQLLLNRMGIDSEYDHHEVANGQHEIDLRYLSALEMADVGMLFRYMVKKVCRMHGLYATFMPKPLNDQNGSGMHVHQSLWRGEKNLFFDPQNEYHLSPTAGNYIAGLMMYSGEIAPVLCQWVNSFKRLIEGYEAPVYIAWGQKNRSAYVRVPEYLPGKERATRIELRSPDPSCNLYLAFATMFTAGLKGIQDNLALPDPLEENIYHMSSSRQKQFRIKTLPRNLEEAIRLMKKSELLRGTLGEHVFHTFIANKQLEIEEYNRNVSGEFDKRVSDYEIRRYMPVL
ncbi:MAG: glutamine synthetase family protein [Acidobacteria bacterium]|nr:glutamine synthetase family protein [Acidobacteriota bacterium]MBU4496204.1 glutamine synthetase family protein [Acidobacteriota bacterium]MCG2814478.1 glutamine synthetase family protein [Candidatus Aminicenantes bacterium]